MTSYIGTQGDDTFTAGSSQADVFTLLGGNDYASGSTSPHCAFRQASCRVRVAYLNLNTVGVKLLSERRRRYLDERPG